MNKYLWKKDGSDREIEKLERLLEPFGFKESCPPEFQFAAGKRQMWKKLLPVFAAPAFAAIIFASVWFQADERVPELVIAPEVRIEPAPVEHKQISELPPSSVTKARVVKPVSEDAFNRKRPAKVRDKRVSVKKRAEVRSESIQTAELTAEEKDAYEMLIRALSITSSKLKLVKEKVHGPEGDDR